MYLCISGKEDRTYRTVEECMSLLHSGQTLDSPTDYERLSADIQSKTGELISVSTLKRLFGYLKPGTVPRPSTLSVLSRYVGFSGWSDFCSGEECSQPCKVSKKAVCRRPIVCVAVVILCISIGWIVWRSQKPSQNSYAGGETPSVVMVSDSEETNDKNTNVCYFHSLPWLRGSVILCGLADRIWILYHIRSW